MKDRQYYASNQELKEKYNSNWHTSEVFELSFTLSLGVVSALKNEDDIIGYAKDLLLFSAVRFMVRDGVYNSLNGNSWFHQSNNSTAITESLGFWYVKVGYLVVAILIYYLL